MYLNFEIIFNFSLMSTLKYHIFAIDLLTIAYILIKIELGAEQNVIEQLEKIEQVGKIDRTFGDYDMVVKIESENIEKIRDTISWKIKQLDKVRSTLTLVKKE